MSLCGPRLASCARVSTINIHGNVARNGVICITHGTMHCLTALEAINAFALRRPYCQARASTEIPPKSEKPPVLCEINRSKRQFLRPTTSRHVTSRHVTSRHVTSPSKRYGRGGVNFVQTVKAPFDSCSEGSRGLGHIRLHIDVLLRGAHSQALFSGFISAMGSAAHTKRSPSIPRAARSEQQEISQDCLPSV